MRWFKHMTDASDDQALVEIQRRFGLDGYARWWKILETVGRQMKNGDSISVTYPWPKWESILLGKRKLLLGYLLATELLGLTKVIANGELITISVPKLLKYRDEYTKKSGHAPDNPPDNVPPRDRGQRTEVRVTPPTPSEEGGKKKRSAEKTEIPEDFKPSVELIAWAEKEHPLVDWRTETIKFVLSARARGARYKRHDSAWKSWISGRFVGGNRKHEPPQTVMGNFR